MPITFGIFRLTLMLALLISLQVSAEYRVVMEPSPPLQFLANNEVRGPVAQRVKEVFRQAQIPAQFEIYPWTRAFNLAKSESNVFISGIARTPERENQFNWIAVVHSFNFALITTNSLIYAETLEDAKQFTVAVQRNDVAHLYLLEMGFSEQENLFVTADITESWRLLNKQKVDFLIEDVDIIDVMARDFLTHGQTIAQIVSLPDLHIDAWLAANPTMDERVIDKLKQAFVR